ncbi:cupin domain-containing protein [Piscinibacter sp.]|uniref:cupin domain-containing protein n=1 Tax=Piscinibacter sp. TaxID=1903157 RepID=UPI002CD9537A|nr:cupin domain-containing protein [Albitalea sp.]HUG25953.1 cupin domain-containing protein [Albitalea sp.]
MTFVSPSFVRLLAASIGAVAILGAATSLQAGEAHHTVVSADAIKWGPAPPSLPPGAQAAVLMGHPGQPGPFVLRLKLPAGFAVPPHRHSKDEMVTVIAGKFGIGSGETLDRGAAQTLPAGSFVHLPSGMPHYALAVDGEAIVQINGVGPFDVTYVNAKDDPRKQQ